MITPEEAVLRKVLVTSEGKMVGKPLDSETWNRIPTAIKTRAFFSSRVSSVRFLDTARSAIAAMLNGEAKTPDGAGFSRAYAVSAIMRAARDAGIATGSGSITDPGSHSRAVTIVSTNAALAAGYVRAGVDNSYGARLAFPAQELVRLEQRQEPRDWRKRWIDAGGRLFSGRMVALKGDPVWLKLSKFGQPYPPFDFNSGMGVADVSRDEAVNLGIIKPDYTPPQDSPLDDFNKGLEAQLDFKNDKSYHKLREAFGDQIRVLDGKIVWRHDLIKASFAPGKTFSIDLGKPSPSLIAMMPRSFKAETFADKSLSVTEDWLDKKRKTGGDHREHFYPLETDDRNIPMTMADLEMLPAIWREPDSVKKESKDRIMLSLAAFDGGVYKAVVELSTELRLCTFYKNKAKSPTDGNANWTIRSSPIHRT